MVGKRSKIILVVDDERSQRELLGSFLTQLGYETVEAASGEAALDQIRQQSPDMVLLDVRLPGINGIQTLQQIRLLQEEMPVLLITAHADLRQAVSALKSGADDYLAKPIDLQELQAAISDALGATEDPASREQLALPELPKGFVYDSPTLRGLLQTVAVVAPSTAPVLITGESGTGKERIAELVHRWSPRANRELNVTNCGGLPDSLIESELFGHTKGAFTGASQARDGVFRNADGGTLFLDEIGELPLHLQPKLLRALETGEIRAVGSDHSMHVDVRLIAATHANLEQAVQDGTFREDLYLPHQRDRTTCSTAARASRGYLATIAGLYQRFRRRTGPPLAASQPVSAQLCLAGQCARVAQRHAACLPALSRRRDYAGTSASEDGCSDRQVSQTGCRSHATRPGRAGNNPRHASGMRGKPNASGQKTRDQSPGLVV